MGKLLEMMAIGPEHDELLVGKERGRTVARTLGGLRQREADLTDERFDGKGHIATLTGSHVRARDVANRPLIQAIVLRSGGDMNQFGVPGSADVDFPEKRTLAPVLSVLCVVTSNVAPAPNKGWYE
jgi:hypothetical protein